MMRASRYHDCYFRRYVAALMPMPMPMPLMLIAGDAAADVATQYAACFTSQATSLDAR